MLKLPKSKVKSAALCLITLMFVGVGVAHFTHEEFFLAIMPDYLPWHLELVWLSGVFEILGGLGVLVPRTRRFAGWGIIALLFAVFPANLNMALNPEQFAEFGPPWRLYSRLPMQAVMLAWVWWATKPEAQPSSAASE